ncbi:MAG TPA: sialidase family protein [Candidatus Dormibacteraeota bacterium]|nr:sialidase family protein [Candidatus Dormibacteraeota bacterium]
MAAVASLALAAPAAAAGAQVRTSHGDPFAACVGVGTDTFGGVNNPGAEVEPWITQNPRDSRNLVAMWQQDRWSDGGAKGLVVGFSADGGRSWRETPTPFSQCAAPFVKQVAPFDRASDPWVSAGPDGKIYGQGLVFNGNDNHNGVASVTSVDGGRTWQNLRLLIDDPASDPTLPVDDKNSVTADPRVPGLAYAVWDRLVNVACGSAGKPNHEPEVDDHPARGSDAAALDCFQGPTLFARTTDGGVTWSTARVIVPVGINEQTIGNQIVVNPRTGVVYDFFNFIDVNGVFHGQQEFSLDHGLTWSKPQEVGLIESAALNPGRGGIVDPRDATINVRTGDIIPEPAIDPETGRLYFVWQDARFNGGKNDQVVISASNDPLGRAGTWTAPRLVNPAGDPAAFNPGVVVNHEGQVAVVFQDFRKLDHAPSTVLPTDVWVRVADGRSLDFDEETHVGRTFNMFAAPVTGSGFFVGDYNSISASARTGAFTGIWVSTNCADTSCTAIANPTGAPTGGSDPTDVFTHRVAGGEDPDGSGQD